MGNESTGGDGKCQNGRSAITLVNRNSKKSRGPAYILTFLFNVLFLVPPLTKEFSGIQFHANEDAIKSYFFFFKGTTFWTPVDSTNNNMVLAVHRDIGHLM